MKEKISHKERFIYIFSIGVLLFLLVLFLILFFSGYLFSTVIDPITNLPLGKSNLVLNVERTQASTMSFSLNGGILPGEKLPQNLNIKNLGEDSVFVRAKAYAFTKDRGQIDFPLEVTNNWLLKDDGYYYYLELLEGLNTIGLASNIVVNDSYEFDCKEKYMVNILVESLSSDLDVNAAWGIDLLQIIE